MENGSTSVNQYEIGEKNRGVLWVYSPLFLVFGDYEMIVDHSKSLIKTRNKDSFLSRVSGYELENKDLMSTWRESG